MQAFFNTRSDVYMEKTAKVALYQHFIFFVNHVIIFNLSPMQHGGFRDKK